MIFTLEPLPAAEGDCLLLHWDDDDGTPRLAVIDGGPGTVWERHLRPRLEAIAKARGSAPLVLDLVMVSHVDADHIVGIKKLFRVLKRDEEDGTAFDERAWVADRLWHNTFNDIIGDAMDAHYRTLTASLAADVGGAPNPELERRAAALYRERTGRDEAQARHVAHDVALILAGHADARELRDSHVLLHKAGRIAPLNSPYETGGRPTLITAEHFPGARPFLGLDITVLGPRAAEIAALQKAFDAYVKSKGLSAEAVLAAYTDDSVPNLSSIVCLVARGDKRVLLTGDARGDLILDGLRDAKLLADEPFFVDVLKVPHHGSDRNVEPAFFERIVADWYVLSGNGKHGNPDRATIEWIVASRAKDARYTLLFTYPLAAIDAERKRDAEKHGRAWNAAADGLVPLLARYAAAGHAFEVVEGAPHAIALG